MLSFIGLLTVAALIAGFLYYRKHRAAVDAAFARLRAK